MFEVQSNGIRCYLNLVYLYFLNIFPIQHFVLKIISESTSTKLSSRCSTIQESVLVQALTRSNWPFGKAGLHTCPLPALSFTYMHLQQQTFHWPWGRAPNMVTTQHLVPNLLSYQKNNIPIFSLKVEL